MGRKLPAYVRFVDDERELGNGIIVTLCDGWCFRADPGCGVRGFDTMTEVRSGVAAGKVYKSA